MRLLDDREKLLFYINKFNIGDFFEKDMIDNMELHLFSRGEPLFKSCEKIHYFYFMVEGKAKVYTMLKNGKSVLLRFYRPLQVLGDVEFLNSDNTDCNVEAVSNVICIGIPMDYLRKEASRDVTFLQFICKNLSSKLANSSYWSSVNLLYPLENRLASYILAITNNDEDYTIPLNEIETHKLTDMAELLGTSYRHLNRTINNLCQKGIIRKERNSIIIIDNEQLEELAGDLYE
ncbi:cyclic nucleotide-binding domain-containing protein [Wukongibacter baidiensis]|uniref:cyclic nucleotide-binding domain-containing protein n=1 Tax=Wukongibacter baidiensis TaxID=1723361 RepID=UPI003D7FA014